MKTRRLSTSEVIDTFLDHPYLFSTLNQWLQGELSDKALIDNLVSLQMMVDMTPVEAEKDSGGKYE